MRILRELTAATIMLLVLGLSQAPAQIQVRPRTVPPVVYVESDGEQLECVEAEGDGNGPAQLCGGRNVRLQVGEPWLRGQTSVWVNTAGLSEVPIPRAITLSAPIDSSFQGTYIEKGDEINALVSGRPSGVKNVSRLRIKLSTRRLVVSPTNPIIFDVRNGVALYLRPGMWQLTFHCRLREAVAPDGEQLVVKPNSESDVLTGRKIGPEMQTRPSTDISPNVSSPWFNPILTASASVKDLVTLIRHRPNILLPPDTQVTFEVDLITATYVFTPSPVMPVSVHRGARGKNE